MKATWLLQHRELVANAKLRQLNPLVHDRLAGAAISAALPTQRAQARADWAACGVSAFGYSGTIAHAVLRSSGPSPGARGTDWMLAAVPLVLHRRVFAWAEARDPSALQQERPLASAIGSAVATAAECTWEHTPTAVELAHFRDHRVGHVPLLPGTCYIEFVRIVVCALHGPMLFSLEEVAFQSILFLDEVSHGAPTLRLQLDRAAGTISVTSRSDEGAWTVHAAMKMRLRAATTLRDRLDPAEIAAQIARSTDHVTGADFYTATGNDYRGEYRALREAWAVGARAAELCLSLVEYEREAAAHPHLRSCAILDACSHAGVWWRDHGGRPFFAAGVDAYHVNSMSPLPRRLWNTLAGSAQEGSSLGDSRIFSGGGDCLVHTEGGRFGYFEAGWLEQRRTRRHIYRVEWEPCRPHLPAPLGPSPPQRPIVAVGSKLGGISPCGGGDSGRFTSGLLESAVLALLLPLSLDKLPLLMAILAVLQTVAPSRPAVELWLLTATIQALLPLDHVEPSHAGGWGLARSARAEIPLLSLHCFDVGLRRTGSAGAAEPPSLATLTGLPDRDLETEVALRGRMRYAPRLRLVDATPTSEVDGAVVAATPPAVREPTVSQCAELFTGGTGALGTLTANWRTWNGQQTHLVLLSRSGALSAAAWERLRARPCFGASNQSLSGGRASSVLARRCDIAELTEVRWVQRDLPPVVGVWHAAAALADALLDSQSWGRLARAYAAKADGACHMQRMFAPAPLSAFVLYSSIAALLGNAAQINYASANACLDALAEHRRARGVNAVSVAWGPWADSGMASIGSVNARMGANGLGLIDAWQGLAALEVAMVPLRPPTLAFLHVRWDTLLAKAERPPPMVAHLAPARFDPVCADGEEQGRAVCARHISLEAVLEMARRTAGSAVDADAPLMDSGLDSLGAVELSNLLQAAVGEEVPLPSTLVFDHPTVRQLADTTAPSRAADVVPTRQAPMGVISCSVPTAGSVVGLEGVQALLPLGCRSVRLTWQLASTGRDAFESSAARWGPSSLDLMPGARHGAFLRGAELFDNGAFRISPAETSTMDPQQRLLLELGYAALHAAGQPRAAMDAAAAVYVGVMSAEFRHALVDSNAYAVTGTGHCFAAGRISYVLGLHGPCEAIDTACSSALVACHNGRRALQAADAPCALVAGVNMMFLLSMHEWRASAGLTSPTGKARVFDARADGWVRGEGCSAGVLRPAKGTATVVAGSVVRQDGRSASLTAPNGRAEQLLLAALLSDATADASQLHVVEAAANGSALGDPIEVGAIAGALLRPRGEALGLPVGSVKGNLGHTEAASGMAGIVKLLGSLRQSHVAPNAQLGRLAPHVRSALAAARGGGCLPVQLSAAPIGQHAGGTGAPRFPVRHRELLWACGHNRERPAATAHRRGELRSGTGW